MKLDVNVLVFFFLFFFKQKCTWHCFLRIENNLSEEYKYWSFWGKLNISRLLLYYSYILIQILATGIVSIQRLYLNEEKGYQLSR